MKEARNGSQVGAVREPPLRGLARVSGGHVGPPLRVGVDSVVGGELHPGESSASLKGEYFAELYFWAGRFAE